MQQPLPFSPGATLDLVWDWSAWLSVGETISSHTIQAGDSITSNSSTPAGNKITAWVTMAQSAKPGDQTAVLCTVTTNQGRTDSRVIRLLVSQR